MIDKLDLKEPIRLQTDRAWRTYLGGLCISKLHGQSGEDGHFPEEWLMSTVQARNAGREHITEGLSMVAGTRLTLKELAEAHPEEMLGAAHVRAWGVSPGVLVKLLDAAERLTIQVHPTRQTARELFDSPFGKTECWHILDTRVVNGEEPCLYLGFREGITREHWKHCFDTQDIDAMLACLHRVPVKVGDTFLIRGGVPHGIGAGCFLVEIQEPTDYTVRTERITPSGLQVADSMCHQGLGFERMFDCFTYEGRSLAETLQSACPTVRETRGEGWLRRQIIHSEVTDLFALEELLVDGRMELPCQGRFCGLYVLSGKGTLNGAPICQCDHFWIPAACEGITLEAETPLRMLRCFGPESTNEVK